MKLSLPTGRVLPGAVLAAAAASALLLTGCTAGPDQGSPDADGTPTAADCTEYSSGADSDSVTVDGDFGDTATADFSTPFSPSELQRTMITTGDGELTKPGDLVELRINVFKGNSGESVISEDTSLPLGDPQLMPAFTAGIECVPIGSRVVTTVPGAELYGDQGNEALGIEPGESAVVVSDVLGVEEPVTPAAWTENPPTVVFNGEEPPVLTLPDGEPSPDLLLDVITPGDGATVQSGDTVTLDYQGTNWNTGEIFDQSYGEQPLVIATNQVVKGFGAALVGQKVGSQLAVTMPPSLGYGEEGAGSELAGQTLVFVIEINGIQ